MTDNSSLILSNYILVFSEVSSHLYILLLLETSLFPVIWVLIFY